MVKYLGGKYTIAPASKGFSIRSNGVLNRAIGAMYGWLVRVVQPSWVHDGIRNSTTFFSSKRIFALNVQCIVDNKKRCYRYHFCIKVVLISQVVLQETELYGILEK